MATHHTSSLIVWADGRQLSARHGAALVWATVEESGHASAGAEIGFRDPSRASLLSSSGIELGSALKLVAVTPGRSTDLFEGEVTGCEARAAGDDGVFTVIRAEDGAHRLKRGSRTVAYHQKSADQIARKLAEDAGLKTGEIDATSVVYEFLTQPAVSDWEFLHHLARENGCDVFVRAGALHFTKPARASGAPAKGSPARQSPFALEYGQNVVKVSSVATLREQVTGVSVRGWDPEQKGPVTAHRSPAAPPTRDVAWQAGSGVVRGEPLLLVGLSRAAQHEVEQVAEAMAQEVAAGLTELHAVVRGEPRLRLRSAVSLTGLGPRFEGRYTVTSVRHEYRAESGYLTELTVREGADRAVAGRVGDGEAGLRRFFGLVPGTVVNIKDPRKQGRVKVELPWLAKEYESNWARTVQLGGGRQHGVVLPELKDEVLVGFEQGCLDRPYVLGGLFNGVDKPEPKQSGLELYDGTKGTANRRSFASKEGHRLELLDAGAQGMGAVLVSGDGKLRIQLDQHKTVISVRSDGTVEIEAKKEVRVKGEGIILDAGGKTLELKGQEVKVSGTQVEMSATADMRVSGSGTVKVKGGALAELSATIVKIN
ncbi:VgrG-related protein [Streptomyces sp. H27-C3]|uniref:VgrG-related protein n=1 Tax=Streptomyces sp. H27-C3 TaxID=3046305 RepID=UPI0024B940DC|nr:VgrG-related protein [Streptomyces sp. H27-C3]MDJ0466199.1 VgrG-related protein [Streptomyces sp. H27-C3]